MCHGLTVQRTKACHKQPHLRHQAIHVLPVRSIRSTEVARGRNGGAQLPKGCVHHIHR